MLLLVSLASLTRVETQVAANNTQLAQARANALFALNLAVGQLQKYAGPDQRVTARADIQTANTGNPLWTGVWDSRPASAANPTHAVAPSSNTPLAWLVSGNETNGTALTPVTPAVVVPATNNDAVWLVKKSVGNDISDTSVYPSDMGVRLAKSLIKAAPSLVPGAGSAGADVTIGAYAWWVGDEGVKARVNLSDPYRSAANTAVEAAYRREAAPKPDATLLVGTAYQTAFANPTVAFDALRESVLSLDQLPLLHADLAGVDGRKQTGGYFHDLTSVGQGVLADTLRGGLRRDLTRGLAAPPTAAIGTSEIGEDVAVFTLPTPGPYGRTALTGTWTPSNISSGGTNSGEPHAPTWSEVRAWTNTRVPAGGSAMSPVAAPLVAVTRNGITIPSTSGHAIMPVVTLLELGYGLDVDDVGRTYRIMIRPVVVLMNPYNVTLNAATYSVTYQSSVTSDSHLTFRMTQGSLPAHPSMDHFLSAGTGGLVAVNPGSGDRRMSFNITDSFGPGEVRVYSLPATGSFQVNDGVFNLAPGLTTNRAYLETGTAVPTGYDPALRDTTSIQWSKIPADHPRISLSLGAATATTVAVPSTTARYIQTASSYLYGTNASPKNVTALLGTGAAGAARQMRTLRYTLRHAELNLLAYPNTNMITQGETGTAPTDTVSGARFLIDGNPRAIISQRLGGRDDVAHYAVQLLNGSGYSDIDYEQAGASTLGFWGGSMESADGSNYSILFDVLRANEEVVSLGRLGQVNWGVDGKHPAYPLGNSFASIFYPAGSPDYGYALNEALWDRFFVSSLPTSLAARPANLPNSRLRFHDPAGASNSLTSLEGEAGYQLAAARLMIDGAFNINSTSVEAWSAFLGSVQAADYAYATQSGNRTDNAVRPFPRLRNFHEADPTEVSGDMNEWTGYRRLSGAQLKQLAAKIVDGIKARGRPARSLAEFMNRDLSKPSTDTLNQMGVVQAAIDTVINTDKPASGGPGLTDLPGLNISRIVPTAFSIADNPDAARGKLRSAGAPGFLLQSDLLTPLAPAMSARSDTFRVRTYGETRNPATGEISGRAWCEAVVQRLPEFVGGEAAELRIDAAALGANSKAFGRKFIITQFRWLGPGEI